MHFEIYPTRTRRRGEKVNNRRLPKGIIIEDDNFQRVIDINLLGSYYVAKYFTPLLIAPENPSTVRIYIVMWMVDREIPCCYMGRGRFRGQEG